MSAPPAKPYAALYRETGLAAYLKAIRGQPVLGYEEIRRLAQQTRAGDRAARQRLISGHLRLVVHFARELAGRGLPLMDLIAEGNLGLIRAADGFDPERNLRFATYAVYWIREAMLRALQGLNRPVRLPGSMVRLVRQWCHTEQELARRLRRPPRSHEVAQALDLPPPLAAQVRQAMLLSRGAQPNEGGLEDRLPDLACPDGGERGNPYHLLALAGEREALHLELRRLEPDLVRVLILRYGLEDGEARSPQEVGRALGLSGLRVQMLERQALARLARQLAAGPDPRRPRGGTGRSRQD
ncbi:MAG: sigma-70 family RNA polymerase sigma factor [Thermodesulfobacteriota bacterium]